jgi:dTDP-4-dehydrorhamnose 3,5-epimerase
MLYVPESFAHGYLTLADNTELFYQVSRFYSPESEGGIRWNERAVNIKWPQTNGLIITDKDKNWPDFPV